MRAVVRESRWTAFESVPPLVVIAPLAVETPFEGIPPRLAPGRDPAEVPAPV
jgi:hypothetical protein